MQAVISPNAETVVEELKRFEHKKNANTYITLTYIDDACYSRKQKGENVRVRNANHKR